MMSCWETRAWLSFFIIVVIVVIEQRNEFTLLCKLQLMKISCEFVCKSSNCQQNNKWRKTGEINRSHRSTCAIKARKLKVHWTSTESDSDVHRLTTCLCGTFFPVDCTKFQFQSSPGVNGTIQINYDYRWADNFRSRETLRNEEIG